MEALTSASFVASQEYNLEQAKCQMRNGNLSAAIDSVDRTVGNSYDMNPRTKTQRLLLAYEIKARCRTKLYDDNAKANSGMGDEGKLNGAIQAWNEFLFALTVITTIGCESPFIFPSKGTCLLASFMHSFCLLLWI